MKPEEPAAELRAMDEARHASPVEAPHATVDAREAPRVLVVDDDVTVRSLAELHLGEAGFDVVTLPEGERVRETFLERRPEAVLLDVMLPDRDGYGICRELRTLPGAEHLPIVMLTSLNDEEAIRSAFEAGATEFLPKPLNWLHETYRLRYLLRASFTMRELHSARETIERGKKEWEQTFDAIDDPVMLLSPELTILRANRAAARLGGLPVEELVGMTCFEVEQCSGLHLAASAVRRALEQGAPHHDEVREYGAEKRDCLVTASPVLDLQGRGAAVVYSVKDITGYRRLEKELLHAQKMEALGVLAAGVAHDFNNLLQGIVGFAELLSMEGRSQAEVQEGLTEIGKIAAKGRALTKRLLLTSRKGVASLGPVAVGPVVGEVAELLRRTTARSIELEASSAPDLWQVRGEEELLHQALMNLAINAAQAMPDGGSLRIRAENTAFDGLDGQTHPECPPGPHVVISIADTGFGMDRATKEKMYEPFFTTKGPSEGTGLGLSVVYGIVRDHGGHLACDSEPGAGTTFRIYLPAVRQASRKGPGAADEHDRRSASGAGRKVLVVDDEPAIRRLVERYLGEHGYRVLTATTGRDALERLEGEDGEFDAIVLDMHMPDMDGETCLAELVSRGCRAPVLLATGALISEDRQARILEHAAGIMTKPFEMKTLLHALTDVVTPGEGELVQE